MRDLSWVNAGENGFDVIAIAASAGGLGALKRVLADLPANFPAAVLVAQHRAPTADNVFVRLLATHTRMLVKQAAEGDRIRPGVVFVSPAQRHLVVMPDGTLSVSRSDRIRFVCPSADLLFLSVADCHAERAVGVVLTGMGSDGSLGVKELRRRGGFVIAQDAATSQWPDMPCAAIETRKVDLVLPLHEIGFALWTLVHTSPHSRTDSRDRHP